MGSAHITVCGTDAASRALVRRRHPASLWLGPDGAIKRSVEAERATVESPEHALLGWPERVGVGTAFHARGRVVEPVEVLRAALSEMLLELRGELGGSVDAVAVLAAEDWSAGRGRRAAGAVHQAVSEEIEGAPVHAVTRTQALSAALDDAPGGGSTLVLDVGAGSVRAQLLPHGADSEPPSRAVVEAGLGGDRLDDRVLRHVLDQVPASLRPDTGSAAARVELSGLRAACRAGRVDLSSETETSILVRLSGASTELRLVRPELEALLDDDLHRILDVGQRAVDAGGGTLTRVLLVGGCASTPRLAQLASARWSCPVDRPQDPTSFVLAGGLAVLDSVVGPPREEPDPLDDPTTAPEAAAAAAAVTDTAAAADPTSSGGWPSWLPDAADDDPADRRRGAGRVLVGAALALVLTGGTGVAMTMLSDGPTSAALSVATETVTVGPDGEVAAVLPGPWAPGVVPPTAEELDEAAEDNPTTAALRVPRGADEVAAGRSGASVTQARADGGGAAERTSSSTRATRTGAAVERTGQSLAQGGSTPSSSSSPASGGGTGTTPAGGGTATAPAGGGTATAPAGGGTATTSAGGSGQTPTQPSTSAPAPAPDTTTPEPDPDPAPDPGPAPDPDPGPAPDPDPGPAPDPDPVSDPVTTDPTPPDDPGTSDPEPTGGDSGGSTSGPGTGP